MSSSLQTDSDSSTRATGRTVISVDAMGGDRGPSVVVAGIDQAARLDPDIGFILHGPRAALEELVSRREALRGRCEIRDAEGVVTMNDKPSQVMRSGKGTSMWSTIDSVRAGEASVAVSCGNTGALMAVAMLQLRKLPGVNRPAIAILWPSRNPQRFNVMLDVGADVRADEQDLLQYALMGASYARNGLAVARPRVGLLNVGTEEHKGRPELRAAHELIQRNAEKANFSYVGFVEGGDIPGARCDVIVTDGFTGNVAIKTGEGTARLIGDQLKAGFRETIFSRAIAALGYGVLQRVKQRIDPRSSNGGVFLGLNGTVVKSHGSADATGVLAAVKLASRLSDSGFSQKLAARVASAITLTQDAPESDEAGEQPK